MEGTGGVFYRFKQPTICKAELEIPSTQKAIHISLISIILSILSGGGDYRGIYDIGLKRGFMGYIGLLLNAPYKIDR
jgi:hypothetical protein